jgi:hypothetical protein
VKTVTALLEGHAFNASIEYFLTLIAFKSEHPLPHHIIADVATASQLGIGHQV